LKSLPLKIKKRWLFAGLLVVVITLLALPEYFHKNAGESESIGSVRNGKLKNGWLLPYRGNNFRYFSWVSYYLLNNAFVHSDVYQTVLDAYAACEDSCPDRTFVVMECSGKRGGRMLFHWTHQNGVSVDFMVPKKRKDKTSVLSNHVGLVHYLLRFSPDGRFNISPKTEIDFEAMAHHLLALDDAAHRHSLRIRKILFHTDLHPELFSTPAGQRLAARDLRFIPHLSEFVNRFHDDHYHVDFEQIDK
jgi:penicillin-insensitive murein endopeptidase